MSGPDGQTIADILQAVATAGASIWLAYLQDRKERRERAVVIDYSGGVLVARIGGVVRTFDEREITGAEAA